VSVSVRLYLWLMSMSMSGSMAVAVARSMSESILGCRCLIVLCPSRMFGLSYSFYPSGCAFEYLFLALSVSPSLCFSLTLFLPLSVFPSLYFSLSLFFPLSVSLPWLSTPPSFSLSALMLVSISESRSVSESGSSRWTLLITKDCRAEERRAPLRREGERADVAKLMMKKRKRVKRWGKGGL
jgi:hypothetical protein